MTFSSPTLTVNLAAITANWRWLKEQFTGEECGVVVKADAYGLGMVPVARALAAAGCNTFFVATLEEGIALRSVLADRRVVVFHGVQEGEALAFVNHRLIPCLNSPVQIERWREVARENREATSVLHLDTAMARLGLSAQEWAALDAQAVKECRVAAMMSHLACASDPQHPANRIQRRDMEDAHARFPEIPVSLCNSGGILLGKAFHCNLARPGCALYGINPHHGAAHPKLHGVAELTAPILQVRRIDQEQAVGYGASQSVHAGSWLATVALGYADGIPRSLSHVGMGTIGKTKVPLVGRVTMDMLVFDISALSPQAREQATHITLIGEHQGVDALAAQAGTIGYEIFARLGPRVRREYKAD